MRLAMYLYAIFILLCLGTKFYFDGVINKKMYSLNYSVDSLIIENNYFKKDYDNFKYGIENKLNKGNKDSLLSVAQDLKIKYDALNAKKDSIYKELDKLGKFETYQYISRNYYSALVVMAFVLFIIIGYIIDKKKK